MDFVQFTPVPLFPRLLLAHLRNSGLGGGSGSRGPQACIGVFPSFCSCVHTLPTLLLYVILASLFFCLAMAKIDVVIVRDRTRKFFLFLKMKTGNRKQTPGDEWRKRGILTALQTTVSDSCPTGHDVNLAATHQAADLGGSGPRLRSTDSRLRFYCSIGVRVRRISMTSTTVTEFCAAIWISGYMLVSSMANVML